MGMLYGTSIDIDDPFFGALEDDDAILAQRGDIAVHTAKANLDGFPEYGFDLDTTILQRLDATASAFLSLEMRTGLEQEPSIQSAEVNVGTTANADGGDAGTFSVLLQGAGGNQAGFTVGD